jgi:hypothetical protein
MPLGWSRIPHDFDDFFLMLGKTSSKTSKVGFMLLAALVWSLWSIRNDMILRNKMVSSSLMAPFRLIGLLLQWKILLKLEEVPTLEQTTKAIQEAIDALRPS